MVAGDGYADLFFGVRVFVHVIVGVEVDVGVRVDVRVDVPILVDVTVGVCVGVGVGIPIAVGVSVTICRVGDALQPLIVIPGLAPAEGPGFIAGETCAVAGAGHTLTIVALWEVVVTR